MEQPRRIERHTEKIVQPTISNRNPSLVNSIADSKGGNIASHSGTLLVPGGQAIQLPKLASLTIDEALALQYSMADEL